MCALTVGVDRFAIRRSSTQGQCQKYVLEHEELEYDCVLAAMRSVKLPNLIPTCRGDIGVHVEGIQGYRGIQGYI